MIKNQIKDMLGLTKVEPSAYDKCITDIEPTCQEDSDDKLICELDMA